ncbi:hypothetical protein MIDIC_70008 [Alphaproteobacteria bacterium]
MIMLGFTGLTLRESSVKDTLNFVAAGKIGGIILYGHNITSPIALKEMLSAFKQQTGENNIFIATDQEGGKVLREWISLSLVITQNLLICGVLSHQIELLTLYFKVLQMG